MTTGNVQQILAHEKTRTRRLLLNQPLEWEKPRPCCITTREGFQGPIDRSLWSAEGTDTEDEEPRRCPFGVEGDRLWIREDHYRYGHWELVPGVLTKGGRPKWRFVADSDSVLFEHHAARLSRVKGQEPISFFYKRLGRFMPRALSRLVVEIVHVEPRRLQDISNSMAALEGVQRHFDDWKDYTNVFGTCLSARASFRTLWQSIHGMDSWDANPWVWDLSFQIVTDGINNGS